MKLKFVMVLFLFAAIPALRALQPGDVILNEVYFHSKKEPGKNHFQAVELLVVADKADLNGLQLSDRPIWNVPKNDQCTLQDSGAGFLKNVPAGTLVVIYDGAGEDDTNASDFVLRFYAQSSLFCNVAPTGSAFGFRAQGMGIHLLHLNKQVDFVKYRASDANHYAPADPGKLNWEHGAKGHVLVGKIGESVGIRFMGNKPDLNDFLAAWVAYSENYKTNNNLGEPNGGRNSEWVKLLRTKGAGAAAKP